MVERTELAELRRTLHVMTLEPPIEPATMDLSMLDPGSMRRDFEHAFAYFQGVESRVDTQYAPSLLALRPGHPVLSVSTPIWTSHENPHDDFWLQVNGALEIRPLEGRPVTERISRHTAARFMLTVMPESAGDIVDWTIAATGESNEFTTGKGYQKIAMKARARPTAEEPFARNMLTIGRQEALHLDFYNAFRLFVERKMRRGQPAPDKTPWQLKVARRIFRNSQHVVGGDDFGTEAVGHMLFDILGDAPSDFAKDVQRKASEILDSPDEQGITEYFKRALGSVATARSIT